MKTVVFFHRLELTDMFAPLSMALAGRVNVVHLAYGDAEREQLQEQRVAGVVVTFKDEVKRLWDGDVDVSPEALERIDSDIVRQTDGSFNLNGAIQSDRGFSLLTYDECLRMTAVYHKFWENFLREHDVDYVMHEPISLMMNFICCIQCKKNDARYVYQIMCPGDRSDLNYLTITNNDFTSIDIERNYFLYKSGGKAIDFGRTEAFLGDFRKNIFVYLGDSISISRSKAKLLMKSVRNRLRRLLMRGRYDRCTDNIDYWELSGDTSWQRLRNQILYSRKIEFSEFDPGIPYYYYPMHLEPEAVVLYHGGGLYRNQIKLVQNIAAQLPPGRFLYVKDHPHDFGYRSVEDYKALKEVPNIRLIKHEVPGKLLIKHAIGVLTINGTGGFEALLMNKQVYTFGNTFYGSCSRVKHVRNVRELRQILYRDKNLVYEDDHDLHCFAAAYLDSLAEGMVDYFAGRATKYGVDPIRNIELIAEDFLRQTKED